jgi:hypothetical protein
MMIQKVNDFLTPVRRKALYGLVAAASAVLVAFGVVDQGEIDGVVTTVTSVVTALVTLMAFLKTNPPSTERGISDENNL